MFEGFPDSSLGKESTCGEEDTGSIPGSGILPGGGSSRPFQYACMKNPMKRGEWWATVHGVTKTQTRLNMSTI